MDCNLLFFSIIQKISDSYPKISNFKSQKYKNVCSTTDVFV